MCLGFEPAAAAWYVGAHNTAFFAENMGQEEVDTAKITFVVVRASSYALIGTSRHNPENTIPLGKDHCTAVSLVSQDWN